MNFNLELAKEFLEAAYKFSSYAPLSTIKTQDILNLTKFDEKLVSQILYYLDDKKYISLLSSYGYRLPTDFTILSDGIDWLNNCKRPDINQDIRIQNNYGAVGSNSNFVINNNFSFEKLDQLIAEHFPNPSREKREVEELRDQLNLIHEHQIPISKGYFSKFSDLMQKHSWLSGQIVGFLIRWITKV